MLSTSMRHSGIRFIPGSHDLALPLDPLLEQSGTQKTADAANSIVREAAKIWWNDSLTDEEIMAQDRALDPGATVLCVIAQSKKHSRC